MIKCVKKYAVGGLAMAAVLSLSVQAADTQGVYPNKIVVGQSAAFEGPASALGLGMRLGIQAAFAEANKSGGVHGRQLELVTYDDGYEPERAIDNTKKLITEDAVFALIGSVGTPTSKATQPIAKAADVPYVGPFTGAGFLRDPANDHVVNVRGTYDQETEAWIHHLTEDLDTKRIAILYQDDSFGRVGLAGVEKALEKRGMELVAKGTYARNSVAVKTALLKIRKSKPEAVVMVGSYKPISAFVKLAKKLRMDSTFVTISFVGSKALANELGEKGEGVVVTQVVPFYEDRSLAVVDAYHKALAAVDPEAEAGFVSLEGYIVGKVFIEGIEKAGADLSRDKFLSVFKSSTSFDFGGTSVHYGPGDNQGMDDIFLSVLKANGEFVYVNRLGEGINTAEAGDN